MAHKDNNLIPLLSSSQPGIKNGLHYLHGSVSEQTRVNEEA